jgi:hypothetical protein
VTLLYARPLPREKREVPVKRLALLAAVSAMLAASGAHAATPSGPGKPTVTLNYVRS